MKPKVEQGTSAALVRNEGLAACGLPPLVVTELLFGLQLSEALGEAVWKESGLGAPLDIDSLQRRITELEHANVELRKELRERDDELDAARTTNRDS